MRCDPGALARDTSDEPRDGWRLASRHESITDRRASIYLARVRRLPSKYNPYLRSTLSVRGPAHAKVPRSEFQCSVGIRGGSRDSTVHQFTSQHARVILFTPTFTPVQTPKYTLYFTHEVHFHARAMAHTRPPAPPEWSGGHWGMWGRSFVVVVVAVALVACTRIL